MTAGHPETRSAYADATRLPWPGAPERRLPGRTTLERLAQHGPLAAARHGLGRIAHRFTTDVVIPSSDAWHNWRLGLDLDQREETAWSASHADYVHYEATPHASFHKAMRRLELDPSSEVFLDYGCGKGKVLAMAARRGFKRVIGVEVDPALADLARNNAARLSRRLASPIEIVTADASQWQVPDDVGVAFFYNPFSGGLLRDACEQLRRSLERRPRPLHIVFSNPRHFTAIADGVGWLERVVEFHHRHRWIVYRALPGAVSANALPSPAPAASWPVAVAAR